MPTTSTAAKRDFVESEACENRQDTEVRGESIFRSSWNAPVGLEDMWTLKRANPVDDDDEDELQETYASPTKRSRTSRLFLESRVYQDDDDDEPIVLLSRANLS